MYRIMPIVGIFVGITAIICVISMQVGSVDGRLPSHEGNMKPQATRHVQPLDDEIVDALRAQDNIWVTAVPPGKRRGAQPNLITATAAIANAQASLGFLIGASATATLVSFTDPNYGPEVTPTPGGEGTVTNPVWSSVSAYAVSFSGLTIPRNGPGDYGSSPTTGVAFVDATTGDVLEFVSLDLTS